MLQTSVKWSVEDYHRMVAAGILEGRWVELLAGDIVAMSPETPLHYNTAKRGTRYLQSLLNGLADVRFNGPITLENSEPEPDMAIATLKATLSSPPNPSNGDRPEEHLDDPRFRGVYQLLAFLLPLEQAQLLRETLIDYAVETKDHHVSDLFIQRLRSRQAV